MRPGLCVGGEHPGSTLYRISLDLEDESARSLASRSDDIASALNRVLHTMNCTILPWRLSTSLRRARDCPRRLSWRTRRPSFWERYGRRAAVLLSPERYDELMEALEEAEDVAVFDAAMSEEGANILWIG